VTELRDEMAKAVEGTIVQLAHVRDCRRSDAAVAVTSSFAENLRDSRGTSMEPYWEAMVSIADRVAATETGAWR